MLLHRRGAALAAAVVLALALPRVSATEGAEDDEVIEWITPTPEPAKPFTPLVELTEAKFDDFVQSNENVLVEL
jgi:hypothetical protein